MGKCFITVAIIKPELKVKSYHSASIIYQNRPMIRYLGMISKLFPVMEEQWRKTTDISTHLKPKSRITLPLDKYELCWKWCINKSPNENQIGPVVMSLINKSFVSEFAEFKDRSRHTHFQ